MTDYLETPVTLIFFTRQDTLEKVFETVRKAKPKKLFLVQDGPRANNKDDLVKIQQCREIVENVDWECEVFKNYSDVNLGCGKRPASGISWVFEHVDRTIILEDDCVPEYTFFAYCQDMLDKFENDERISYISGLNHFSEWDCGEYSYFFAKTGAIWGWATWKRAWDRYDYYVNAIKDPYIRKTIPYQITDKETAAGRIDSWLGVVETIKTGEKLSYWDVQWGLVKYSQSQLVVVPRYNQIMNIGVGESSTHAQSVKDKKFKFGKSFFFIPTRKLEFPLTHQNVCMCDVEYDNRVYKSARGNKYIYKLKRLIKKIIGR